MSFLGEVDAWNFNGHQAIVETAYYHAGFSLQQRLNLTLLKEGSIAPDKNFHDVRLHHYPPSYYLAERWLKSAKNNYSLGDYNKASYAFGVASHYISDSFVAPHYTSREPGSLHAEFERLKNFRVNIKCYKSNIDLNESLYQASRNREDWTSWVLSKNESIPRKEFEQAINLTIPVFITTFNSTCNLFQTEIIKRNFIINQNMIIFLSLISMLYLTTILNKKFKIIRRIRF